MSYHPQSVLCIYDTYVMHMHAIGAVEEITLVELKADPQEENLEVQHQEALGEGEPKVDHLLECPDHQPATFVKDMPRSIQSLPCFTRYYLSPLCLMH